MILLTVKIEILLEPTSNKLMVGSIYTDQRGTVVITTIFDELKNFKRDATLKLFKSTNQERYEHVGPEVTRSHGGKLYKMAKRDNAWLMISRKKKKSLDYNNLFFDEYECSSLALDKEERKDEKKRLDHLKQDQTMLVIKRFSKRKKVFRERKKTEKFVQREKFGGGLEQEIDDEGEEDKEDEEGDGGV
ncbi:hypothetical protein Tco_0845801 [Tanacetum coccineum]